MIAVKIYMRHEKCWKTWVKNRGAELFQHKHYCVEENSYKQTIILSLALSVMVLLEACSDKCV